MPQGKIGPHEKYGPSGPVKLIDVKTRRHLDSSGRRKQLTMEKVWGGRWAARQVGEEWILGLIIDLDKNGLVNRQFVTTHHETGEVFAMNIYLGNTEWLHTAAVTELPIPVRFALREKARELGATALGYPS